ncbi:hypothetical protein ACWCW0_22115, partial [Streptomyces sp. NPDC001758]
LTSARTWGPHGPQRKHRDHSERRALTGKDSLESYRERGGSFLRGQREAVLEESAVELIADLLHWTSARGLDPDDMLDRAQMHYEAEVA